MFSNTKLKILLVAVFILLTSLLICSPLIIDVSHVYYNMGDVSISLLPEGFDEFNDDYTPTVWCCGIQQFSFDPPPCVDGYCYIRIAQGNREVVLRHQYINPSGQVTHLYMDLGVIPNYQHRQESK